MSINIVESVTRPCCRWPNDFSTYKGLVAKKMAHYGRIWFCKHCGQLWINHREPGELDAGLTMITIIEVTT